MKWARFHPNKGKYHAYPQGGERGHDGVLIKLGHTSKETMCGKHAPIAPHQTAWIKEREKCKACSKQIAN